MKKYFNYTPLARKKIVMISVILIGIAIVLGFLKPPFLLTFANVTFIAGLLMVCISCFNGFRVDHKIFKDYAREVASGNDITIDQYKKMNVDPTFSVFTSVGCIVLIIGIIASIIA